MLQSVLKNIMVLNYDFDLVRANTNSAYNIIQKAYDFKSVLQGVPSRASRIDG